MKQLTRTIGAYAYFPVEGRFGDEYSDGRGGPVPDDPTTIYFVEQSDPDNEGEYHWTFTLTELVDYMIDSVECGEGRSIGTEHVKSLELLRDGFRKLADQIDAALARPK